MPCRSRPVPLWDIKDRKRLFLNIDNPARPLHEDRFQWTNEEVINLATGPKHGVNKKIPPSALWMGNKKEMPQPLLNMRPETFRESTFIQAMEHIWSYAQKEWAMTGDQRMGFAPPTCMEHPHVRTRRPVYNKIMMTGIPKFDPWTRGVGIIRGLLSPQSNPILVGITKIRWSKGVPGYFDPEATVDAEYTFFTEAPWHCLFNLSDYKKLDTWEKWNQSVLAAECYSRMRILMEDFGVAIPPPMEPAIIPYHTLDGPFENLLWRKLPSYEIRGDAGLLVPFCPATGLQLHVLCRGDQTDTLPPEFRPIDRKSNEIGIFLCRFALRCLLQDTRAEDPTVAEPSSAGRPHHRHHGSDCSRISTRNSHCTGKRH